MSEKHEYAEGYTWGAECAEHDRTHGVQRTDLDWREESAQTGSRLARAFSLGAARGYRSVTRTLNAGRWGT